MLNQMTPLQKTRKLTAWKVFSCAILIVFVLAACGSPATSQTQNAVETPTAVPTPEAKPFRVAVILPSASNDLAFSQSMFDALNQIQSDMGGPEKMQFAYSQGMFVLEDAATALQTYAAQGYDLVIAHGSQYGDAVKAAATAHPDVSFVWSNPTASVNMPNIFEVTAEAQQGGYVNGVLAATLTKSKMIGIVGPVETGDAKQYVDSFKAGVLATDPSIQVLVKYVGSFSDVVKGTQAADEFIATGADVLTGSSQMVVGPIGTADKNKVLWFGTQSNQTSLAPNVVVANQVYHWEVALKEIIADIRSGVKGNQKLEINLANGGLVIEYNPDYAISAEAKALGDATVKGIDDGTISLP